MARNRAILSEYDKEILKLKNNLEAEQATIANQRSLWDTLYKQMEEQSLEKNTAAMKLTHDIASLQTKSSNLNRLAKEFRRKMKSLVSWLLPYALSVTDMEPTSCGLIADTLLDLPNRQSQPMRDFPIWNVYSRYANTTHHASVDSELEATDLRLLICRLYAFLLVGRHDSYGAFRIMHHLCLHPDDWDSSVVPGLLQNGFCYLKGQLSNASSAMALTVLASMQLVNVLTARYHVDMSGVETCFTKYMSKVEGPVAIIYRALHSPLGFREYMNRAAEATSSQHSSLISTPGSRFAIYANTDKNTIILLDKTLFRETSASLMSLNVETVRNGFGAMDFQCNKLEDIEWWYM